MATRPQNGLPLVERDLGPAPDHLAGPATRPTLSRLRWSVGADRLSLLPPSKSRTVAASRSFATFRETLERARAPGIATMVVGAAAVTTGMLAVGGSLALIVGAVVGALGIRWTLQPIAGSGRRYAASGITRPRTGRVTFLLRVWQNGARADLILPSTTDPTMNLSSQSFRTRSHFTRLIDGAFGRGGPYLLSTLHQGGRPLGLSPSRRPPRAPSFPTRQVLKGWNHEST